MACTTYSLSPERRQPLHTQVVNLKQERVELLETNRALREERDMLRRQLEKASERISELQGKVDEQSISTRLAAEEATASKQSAHLHEAVASQLRVESQAWQQRLEQSEAEARRRQATDDLERRQTAEQTDQERFRLLGDLAAAQSDKKRAEDQWRLALEDSNATRQMLEAQRDEALSRATHAEDALAVALHERRTLSDSMARVSQQAAAERTALEIKADAAEKRWSESHRRCEELSHQRLRLEHTVVNTVAADAKPSQSRSQPPSPTSLSRWPSLRSRRKWRRRRGVWSRRSWSQSGGATTPQTRAAPSCATRSRPPSVPWWMRKRPPRSTRCRA